MLCSVVKFCCSFDFYVTMSNYCCYDILRSDTYGRYAVASADFKPGDLIISELPFTYGPKSDSPPVCLGCHCGVDGKTMCTACGWPVCDEKCQALPVHSDNECIVFSKSKIKFRPVDDLTVSCPQYECIMPLRVLLCKERKEEEWEEGIKRLEAHREKRQETEMWGVEAVNVVGFLHKVCNLQDRFPEELIHFACGILEVNAFVAPNPYGFDVRCLYPKASLLTHSCVPNVGHYVFSKSGCDVGYRIYVRAMINIPKGEQLLLTYTQTLSPTLVRRAHLREGKYFDCACLRCADPTELGTNLSTMKCRKCTNGYMLSTNPLDEAAPWACGSCDCSAEAEEIMKILFQVNEEASQLQLKTGDPIASREEFINKYQPILHSKHAIIMNVKSSLSQLYGKTNSYLLKDLPVSLLQRKIDLCNEIGEISDKIKPGISRQRGWNLYELYAPIILLAKKQHQQNIIDKKDLLVKFGEAAKYLEEVSLIFSYEDPDSYEGVVGKSASQTLKELRATIATLSD